jgi:hypothetical protein
LDGYVIPFLTVVSLTSFAGVIGCIWFVTHTIAARLDLLHRDLNSRLTELIDLTRTSSFAEGVEATRREVGRPLADAFVYRDPPK